MILFSLMACAVAVACVIYFTDRSQFTREISAQDFGGQWPWRSVSKAMLQCHLVRDSRGHEAPSIQVVLDGTVYALDASAITEPGAAEAQGRNELLQRGREICGLPRV